MKKLTYLIISATILLLKISIASIPGGYNYILVSPSTQTIIYMQYFFKFPHFYYYFSPEFIAHTESFAYFLKKGSHSSGISMLSMFLYVSLNLFLYLFCHPDSTYASYC